MPALVYISSAAIFTFASSICLSNLSLLSSLKEQAEASYRRIEIAEHYQQPNETLNQEKSTLQKRLDEATAEKEQRTRKKDFKNKVFLTVLINSFNLIRITGKKFWLYYASIDFLCFSSVLPIIK